MADFGSFRSRNRFQRAGVSDVMVRLKDMVIAQSVPALSVPVPFPSQTCQLEVIYINPVSVLDITPTFNYPQQGILSWNNGSIYKTSNLMNSFKQRYFKSFAVTCRRTSYTYG